MSTIIDAPGLAKLSAIDRVRDLTNERQRNLRRLKNVQLKLAGLQALKKDLQPWLQPGDYEHIKNRLKAEAARRLQEEIELADRLRDARHAAWMAEYDNHDRKFGERKPRPSDRGAVTTTR